MITLKTEQTKTEAVSIDHWDPTGKYTYQNRDSYRKRSVFNTKEATKDDDLKLQPNEKSIQSQIMQNRVEKTVAVQDYKIS